jgi:hypothetical protein
LKFRLLISKVSDGADKKALARRMLEVSDASIAVWRADRLFK